ncbi:hypothetical protein CO230_11630 [Chryseobacterium sp. 6424]|nr:hypothetical protein CO230_11630 [Chryseobacterium sp. 6424]
MLWSLQIFAQMHIQGDITLSVTRGAYIHTDSLKISGKASTQKFDIEKHGNVYVLKQTDSLKFHNAEKPAHKTDILAVHQPKVENKSKEIKKVTARKKVAHTKTFSQKLPKIYHHSSSTTLTFIEKSKNLAVTAGGFFSFKSVEKTFVPYFSNYFLLKRHLSQNIFHTNDLCVNIWSLNVLKVRPPPQLKV